MQGIQLMRTETTTTQSNLRFKAETKNAARIWPRSARPADAVLRHESQCCPEYSKLLAEAKRRSKEEAFRKQALAAALQQSKRHAQQVSEHSRQLQKKLRAFSHRVLAMQEQQRK